MTRPRVSVIIPAFNAGLFVGEAVESALAQTIPDVEIIVVNDGSTDHTSAVLASYEGRIVVINQPNRGLAAARNSGGAIARGEWLAFLDADDLWNPDKLEKQIAAGGPAGQFVYTDRYNIGERGPLPERQSDVQAMYEGDVFQRLLIIGNVITASSVMMRRQVFQALGGFCEELSGAADWDLWIRFAAEYPVRVCNEPLVSYRFHSSMMSGDPAKMNAERNQVIARALTLPRARSLSPSVKRRIWATTCATNGWDAARRARRRQAIGHYARAIGYWPFASAPYRELLRACVGRS
jgi:glycosyltransferase involved in cell wall biosynthesis